METAPQFIWRNLQKNLTVVAESRNEEGKPAKLIEYRIPDYQNVPDERCWMCGGLTEGRGIPVADRISDTFTDVYSMKWPESKSLCMACSAIQSQKPFRLYSSLITEEGVRHVARATWAEVLTHPPDPPWAAYLAVSGQKHLFFRGQVNYQNRLVYVQMEEIGIRFDPAELSELLTVVERLYTIFTKDEILSGDYSSGLIQLYGLADFERDEWHASRYRGERLLNLAVWIARRDAEARETRLAAAKERKEQRTADATAPKAAGPRTALEPEPETAGQMSLF